MTIQQLSVFIENKSGTLQKVLNLLKEAGIQLIASTIADTVEYGIYRIICSEPKRAYETLKEAGISVALSDVFAITLDNQPGRAADAITIFSEAQIGITYLYSFLLGNKGILIFRTDNPDRAREVIILNNLSFVAEKDLSTLIISIPCRGGAACPPPQSSSAFQEIRRTFSEIFLVTLGKIRRRCKTYLIRYLGYGFLRRSQQRSSFL